MGTLYERISLLCAEKGIKGGKMCTDLGISKGLMSDLKMGRRSGVSTATAHKIANYFNVSIEYLLGKETKKAPTEKVSADILDEVDIGFYNGYKELDEADKEVLRDMVRVMRERRLKKNEP